MVGDVYEYKVVDVASAKWYLVGRLIGFSSGSDGDNGDGDHVMYSLGIFETEDCALSSYDLRDYRFRVKSG